MRVEMVAFWALLGLSVSPAQSQGVVPHDYILSLAHATFIKYPARWEPTAAQAAEAKAAITAWLGEEPPRSLVLGSWVAGRSAPAFARRFPDYDLQYVGVFMSREPNPAYRKSGDRVILIHGFRRGAIDAAADRPDIQEVIVFDGGENFFEAEYDVDTRKLLSFHTHGIG